MNAEGRSLRRSRWLLTAQLAGAITAVVALVGVLVLAITVTTQRRSDERDLRYVLAHSEVASPPPCVWIFAADGRRTPGAPRGLPVTGGRPTQERSIDGRHYLIHTEPGGQAVMDLLYQDRDRDRLLLALLAAEAAGLLAALVTGQLLARRAISPLAEALTRQRRFVADASHELRTPLTRLHLRAQLLARRTPGAELDAILSDTRQFGEVIEDLLLSAQIQSGSVKGAPVDLAAVAASVVRAESARAQAGSVTIELTGPDGVTVNGVEAALRRVVAALVDNALGHTPPGGRIEVILGRPGKSVELTVRDDGRGLDPGQADRIFRRFAHGEGRRFGLGLALVREVVESHGGSVTATGERGTGASFTVVLPSANPALTPD